MNLNIIKLNQIINDYIQNIKENSISFHECQLLIDRHSRENIQGKELQINLQQSCQQQFETVIHEYIQCFRKLLQSFLFLNLKIVNHNINQNNSNEHLFDLSKEFQWKNHIIGLNQLLLPPNAQKFIKEKKFIQFINQLLRKFSNKNQYADDTLINESNLNELYLLRQKYFITTLNRLLVVQENNKSLRFSDMALIIQCICFLSIIK